MSFKLFLEASYPQYTGQSKLIGFIEEFCGASQQSFADRLALAPKWGFDGEDLMKRDDVRDLIHIYFSSYKYSNKHMMLVNYQLTLWRINKLFLESEYETDIDQQAKNITLMDKMVDLSWKLEQKITGLYSEIYGAKEIQEMGAEHVKVVLGPEQRLKMRRKQKEEKV